MPNKAYLMMNEARYGRAGFALTNDINLSRIVYDPSNAVGAYTTVMALSTTARLYHSETNLLIDDRVLVSGSGPENERSHPAVPRSPC